MIAFLRDNVWAHLPKAESVTRKTRINAALLWGLFLPLFYLIVSWIRHRDETEWARGPLIVFLPCLALGLLLLIPGIGAMIYVGVLRFFGIFGFIVGNVGLTLIFYVVVTPIGAVLKLTGKDAMNAGFKTGKPPRWREHPTKSDPRSYYRLF